MKFKIAINNPTHSRQVQEALFALGVSWAGKDNGVEHTDKGELYIGSSSPNRITNSSDRAYFAKHKLPEYEFVGGKFVPKGTGFVRTREQVAADRRKELLDGVVARHTAGQEVPQEWLNELTYGSR